MLFVRLWLCCVHGHAWRHMTKSIKENMAKLHHLGPCKLWKGGQWIREGLYSWSEPNQGFRDYTKLNNFTISQLIYHKSADVKCVSTENHLTTLLCVITVNINCLNNFKCKKNNNYKITRIAIDIVLLFFIFLWCSTEDAEAPTVHWWAITL